MSRCQYCGRMLSEDKTACLDIEECRERCKKRIRSLENILKEKKNLEALDAPPKSDCTMKTSILCPFSYVEPNKINAVLDAIKKSKADEDIINKFKEHVQK